MRVLLMTFAVFLCDQVTKLAVRGIDLPGIGLHVEGMSYGQSIPLLGDWLKITFIENPNMAFGLDIGGKSLLAAFAIIASLGIVVYLYMHRNGPTLLRVALALVLAGALGNLVDRVFYGVLFDYASWFQGNVVDFMDLDLFTLNFGASAFKFWPIFNVADAAVSIGVVMLLLASRPVKHPASATTASPTSSHATSASSATPPKS